MLLENTRLVEELRASRSRIVDAADHERRRLERDLHDGAQQRLVAIQIRLRLAQEQIDDDRVVAQLEAIGSDGGGGGRGAASAGARNLSARTAKRRSRDRSSLTCEDVTDRDFRRR